MTARSCLAVRWNAGYGAVLFGDFFHYFEEELDIRLLLVFIYDLEYIMVDAPLLQRHLHVRLLDAHACHLSHLPEVVGPQHLHARALQFVGVAPLRHPHLDER